MGGLSFNYVPVPDFFKAKEQRKAQMCITKGNVSVSSVFVPDLQAHQIAYGDVNGTNDAIIFLFSTDRKQIELFIARGYCNDVFSLYDEVKQGGLDEEIEALRAKAKDVFKEKSYRFGN